MATIRVVLRNPRNGDALGGGYRLTPKPMPGAGLWVEGRDIMSPSSREGSLTPSDYSTIDDVEVPGSGWYYHLEGWESDPDDIGGPPLEGGFRFSVNFLLLEEGTFEIEDLPVVDPCDPESGARPEPAWWRALRAVQDSLDGAVEDAEDAATRAEAAAMTGSGFSRHYDFRAYSEGPDGEPTLVHGDPDAIMAHSVASITKLLSCLVFIEEAERLDRPNFFTNTTVTTWEMDRAISPGSLIQAGDGISYQNLLRLAILPSNNVTPVTLAVRMGGFLLDDEGEGTSSNEPRFDRFVKQMNIKAQELGFTAGTTYHPGASFTRPGGAGRMSPRQVATLIRACRGNSRLSDILGQDSQEVEITGSNSRTITINSIISNQSIDYPENLGYKGGNQLGRTHSAMIWEHPETEEEHVTVITDVLPGAERDRYELLRDAMDLTIEGGGAWYPGFSTASGEREFMTPRMDITDKFNVEEVGSGANPGVYVFRVGNMVTLSVFDIRFSNVDNDSNIGNLPHGFRPLTPAYGATTQFESGNFPRGVTVSTGGNVHLLNSEPTNWTRFTLTFPTYNSWPEAPDLPGVPHAR